MTPPRGRVGAKAAGAAVPPPAPRWPAPPPARPAPAPPRPGPGEAPGAGGSGAAGPGARGRRAAGPPARVGAPLLEGGPRRGPGRGPERGAPLALPLVVGSADLPRAGRTQTEAELACDPWTQSCEMAPQVWESQCATCGGTGFAGPSRSSSRGRRGRTGAGRHRPSAFAAVCPACLGVGWHRLSSDRVGPEPAPDGTLANPNKTLARPAGTTDRAGPFPFAPRQLKPFQGGTAQESLRPSVGDRVNHVEDELTT